MAVLQATIYLILGVFKASFALTGVNICRYDYGRTHQGTVPVLDRAWSKEIKGCRSRMECATHCFADITCLTAIYDTNRLCLLSNKFFSQLEVETDTSACRQSYIMEMRSGSVKRSLSESWESVVCPSNCTTNVLCYDDCTNGSLQPEPACMDIATTGNAGGYRWYGIKATYRQATEYFLPFFSKTSSVNGETYFTVRFTKQHGWTVLRVKWRGTLRGAAYTGDAGSRNVYGWWQILFNGIGCGIESFTHNKMPDINHHRSTGIHGMCANLDAGDYNISLTNHMTILSDFYVGHAAYNCRLYVEEIALISHAATAMENGQRSSPVFNLRQYKSDALWNVDSSGDVLWNGSYNKLSDNSWLRVNIDFVVGVLADSCAMWSVLIDSEACSPVPMDKIVVISSYPYVLEKAYRSVEVEGHCSDVPAGKHNIELHVGGCYAEESLPFLGIDNSDLEKTIQRFLIEEFLPGTNTVAELTGNGREIYRIPQFNIAAHGYVITADEEYVWNITDYKKIYNSSGLRVQLSADARCYVGCCRHYFTFNGQECSNPGTIEGVNVLHDHQTLFHLPMMIEGICEGIPAGDVTLRIHSGLCYNYSEQGDSYFGLKSTVSLMISEAYVDRETLTL